MEFHPFLVKIIDTPQFQRLRYIKQLGGVYFVYPGASHNRFEHSLGTAHLAGQLVRSLQEKQPELGIDVRDILCVEIAGLCHDLGHGPFSHLFDGKFIPKAQPDLDWQIVKDLKDQGFDLKKELEKLDENTKGDDLLFIKEMINGPDEQVNKGDYKGRPPEKSFLYEIISNKRNGLDVDKFDYFARDYHHLGMKNTFDHNRYIEFVKVFEVDGRQQICTRDKELPNMYEMFHTRSSLHRKACQHKTHIIIEMMLRDALLKANTVQNERYSKAIDDVQKYTKLTGERCFEEILNSTDEDLKEARDILQNVLSRKLYRCLGKIKLTDDIVIQEEKWKTELSTDQEELPLNKDDFEISIVTFDFGKKEENPMDNLYSYDKFNNTLKIPREQVSQFLLPNKFSEKWIYVVYKNSDENALKVAKKNFFEWCHKKNFNNLSPPLIIKPQLQTPQSQPKVFNDPIHGHMEFEPLLVKIIDTPEFQRLRYIKQLGAAYFVYPGASHNQFEHSLGDIVKRLREDDLTEEEQTFIEDIIQDKRNDTEEKAFLYDIITNKRNGLGVKLFDSVARDCYHLGLKTNFDHQRLIKFAKVLKKQICFRDKVVNNILDLFHTYTALQNKAYQHKVTLSIQQMMSEVIEKEMHTNKQLTDSLWGKRFTDNLVAKDIMEKIHTRKLYTFVAKVESRGAEIDPVKHFGHHDAIDIKVFKKGESTITDIEETDQEKLDNVLTVSMRHRHEDLHCSAAFGASLQPGKHQLFCWFGRCESRCFVPGLPGLVRRSLCDYAQVCKSSLSCKSRCDEAYNSQNDCHCNSKCSQYNNCCSDYASVCGADGSSVSDAEIKSVSEALFALDANKASGSQLILDPQDLIPNSETSAQVDLASKPLFRYLDEGALFSRPTYAALLAVLDNYHRMTGQTESFSEQQLKEQDQFVRETMSNTEVGRELFSFFYSKGVYASEEEFIYDLKMMWFGLYSRSSGQLDSSGFEHIFAGEVKGGKVSGFHNWIQFYSWRNEDCSTTTATASTALGARTRTCWGCSSDGTDTLSSLCYITRPGKMCYLSLGGKELRIQTYTWDKTTYGDGKKYIGSAFPATP
ncbi:hypothetical protein WMY93_011232 [Mugilogobius chulae]|uniref:Uridylate-specific endoribonuclease n=1 Tax=Mugilogobius chulae TaxID=88201 RepID=A0AAW0P7T6_9GOBI